MGTRTLDCVCVCVRVWCAEEEHSLGGSDWGPTARQWQEEPSVNPTATGWATLLSALYPLWFCLLQEKRLLAGSCPSFHSALEVFAVGICHKLPRVTWISASPFPALSEDFWETKSNGSSKHKFHGHDGTGSRVPVCETLEPGPGFGSWAELNTATVILPG